MARSTTIEIGLIAVLAAAAGGVYVALQSRPAAAAAEPAEAAAVAEATPAEPVLAWEPLSDGLPTEGHWRGKPAFADLDGDGDLDLVGSIRKGTDGLPGEGLHVWLQADDGSWVPANEGLPRDMGYGGSEVADVDGDGHLDLAFSGHDVPPRIFTGDGAGTWLPAFQAVPEDGVCADVALGDVDGDGRPELAALGFFPESGGLRMYRQGPEGWEPGERLLPEGHFGAQVAIRDLDGDGRGEVIAATELGPKVWSRGDDGWVDRSEGLPVPEVGGSDLVIDAADLDGDGHAELLCAGMIYDGHPPMRVFRWDGAAWGPWGEGLPDGEAFFDAEVAELDGEGGPEIVAMGKRGLLVVTMPEPGRFEVVGRLEDTLYGLHLTCGDVDDDGRDEIALFGFDGVRILDPAGSGGRP